MQSIYPIGSIYSSTESTSPATLFGFGTWERIKDRFLLAAGDTYTAGDTGGAASVSYTPAGTVGGHTLTVSEIPSHSHTFTGSAVTSGNNSVGHTHTYTDYYATTTGSTAIKVANLASHNHAISATKSWDGVTLGASDGAINGGTYPKANNSSNYSNRTTTSTGSNTGHTHSGANTSTTRTSNGISANHTHSVTAKGSNSNTGGGGPHNHGFTGTTATILTMPPYLAVYLWKRTA